MFLTKITLNPERSGARKFVSNPQTIHAAVNKAFSSEQLEGGVRPLWRLETTRRDPEILIMSGAKPDVAHIVEQAGRANDPNGVRYADYSGVIASIRLGNSYRFKVRANPVKRRNKEAIPHITPSHIKAWFEGIAASKGFYVTDGSFEVSDIGSLSFGKREQKAKVSLAYATFEGVLSVTDMDSFINCLQYGLGRGKAYGLGMLTLARI